MAEHQQDPGDQGDQGESGDTVPLLELGSESFVSLTTFRRTGEPVATPVWVARDGGVLVVQTADGTGKVRRLRRDPRVELRPCTRSGAVAPNAPVGRGVVEIDLEPAAVAHATAVLRRKYGFQYAVFTLVRRVASRGPRHIVILRISSHTS